MEQVGSKILATLQENSLTKPENSNIKRALADRLLISEAIDLVAMMIRGYANRGQADKAYIGAIAQILMHYPRQVALKCADPFNGVVRDTKFMPTPADVIGWCEKAVAPMHGEAAREDRIKEQLRARDEWKPPQVAAKKYSATEISYKQFLENCEKDGRKPRPIGAFEKGGYMGPTE